MRVGNKSNNEISRSISPHWMKRALINVEYFSFFFLKRGKREIRRGKGKNEIRFYALHPFLRSLIFVVNQLSLGFAIRL